jgi:hypothetical protein
MSLPSWLGSGPYPPAPDKPRRPTTPKGPVLLVGTGPFTSDLPLLASILAMGDGQARLSKESCLRLSRSPG